MPAITPRETAEQFLRATVSPDPGDMADFYAPDVVIEMPFAPAGLYPARTRDHPGGTAGPVPGGRRGRAGTRTCAT